MKSLKLMLLGLSAASLLVTQAAQADTIQINGWWANPGTVAFDYAGPTLDGPFGTEAGSGGAGAFSATNVTTGGDSFQAWCIDIFHTFGFPGSSTDNLVLGGASGSLLSAAQTNALGVLYSQNAGTVAGHDTSANDSAAFQLAVWAIVNEDNVDALHPYSLNYSNSGTTLTMSGDGAATAATWLTALNSALASNAVSLYTVSVWQVTGDGNCTSGCSGAQDVAVFTTPVPEPETYAMMLAGLGLMGFVARRRKQQVTAA